MTEAPDAIRTQLVWNRLLAIVEEQAQTLMRTAFSTVVREAGDLSAGVFNTQGEMLAQAVTGTPGHVNAMAASVGKFLNRHPLATLEPGDVLLTNDPWDGTGHLNDFTVVTPVFRCGQPVGLFASTSHIADVGGRGFGPDASQVFEEGLNIPIGFLFRAGEPNQTLLSILAANVRDPVVAQGDLYSLAACNDAGGRELLNTLDDFELPDLDSTGRAILETSERAMRREIAALPDGRHHYEMRVDGYDAPVDLRASLTIAGEAMRVDFEGTSGLSPFGINVPLPYTQAYASFGARCIVGNDIPNNAGSLRCIEVSAPTGCILNALPPAAVSARHAIGQMLPDVVLGCLEQALPGQTPAEGASCIWNPVFLGAAQGGNSPGEDFVINPIFNGGAGARPTKDGLSTTAFPSGVRTTPTEVNEATSPLVIWRKEYRPGSGGSGKFRGGHGQIIEIAHREGAPFHISKMFDRIRFPARGRAGGGPGQPGRVYLKDGPDLPGKGKDLVPAGAVLVLETPGGGGMGDAGERDAEALQADVEAGLALVTVPGLRSATGADAAGIAQCVRAAYTHYVERIGTPPGPMLDDYHRVVRDHRAHVIDDGGEIVGVLVLMDKEDGLLLDNVAVLPSRQGEGIGRRLVEHAEAEAHRLGHRHLDLYTHEQMTENIAMYLHYGYEEIERRTERGFPRVYMRKKLRELGHTQMPSHE